MTDDTTVAAALAGDEAAFGELAGRHRRELHVHCYRMLASFDEAEDAVQETLLRAWRHRDSFTGGALFRAWLYRIATNVCLDLLRSTARNPVTVRSFAEVPWLQPYPDRLLDEAAEQPDAVAIARETIELAFLVALQTLPPRQRATLIARDVLGWPAGQTAELLETSVASVNSALQRARATMQEQLPDRRSEWTAAAPSAAEREILRQFIDATERCDARTAVAIAARDIRVTMPPYPYCFDGLAALEPLLARAIGPDREGDWRLLPTMANRMPAAASYLRRHGDTVFRAFKLDVLRVRGDQIAEITTFGPELFPAFGLAPTL
ncbi:MAG TPA: RNA polymerase subunit sigma-70 [Pseudonocardiaceae bacterium]|nr:RNA polymerase subunit sigma-70 [Pseudonocardiaceae bacterium]